MNIIGHKVGSLNFHSIGEFIELPVSSLLVAASLALESFPPQEREKVMRDEHEALEAMDAKRQEAN